MPKKNLSQEHGVLVLDKPQGPTSTQCLNKIKNTLGQKKIGHAGTLDPLARGVLIVLLGQGTKLAQYLTQGNKVYKGILCLSHETDTYDIQGNTIKQYSLSGIKPEDVKQELLNWQSLTEQPVPPFSAAKHKGKPLHRLARQGQEVPKKNKSITIDQVEVLEVSLPKVSFRLTCSHGTYIRSLAHSLGKRIGCGAVLEELTREKSEPFSLEQAVPLQDLLAQPDIFLKKVIPLPASLPHWPQIRLTPEQTQEVMQGMQLLISQTPGKGQIVPGQTAMFISSKNEALALVQAEKKGNKLCWSILRGLWEARN